MSEVTPPPSIRGSVRGQRANPQEMNFAVSLPYPISGAVKIVKKISHNYDTESIVFRVTLTHDGGKSEECIMKLHDSNVPEGFYDRHAREKAAYQRLYQARLHERGYVPRYIGSWEEFDTTFIRDQWLLDSSTSLANALFIEYIPGLVPLDVDNFTPEGFDDLLEGLKAIHAAGVLHNDGKIRNMMVLAKPGPVKMMWIDFNSAETYDPDHLTPEQKKRLDDEQLSKEYLKTYLIEDKAEGKINKAGFWFYT